MLIPHDDWTTFHSHQVDDQKDQERVPKAKFEENGASGTGAKTALERLSRRRLSETKEYVRQDIEVGRKPDKEHLVQLRV